MFAHCRFKRLAIEWFVTFVQRCAEQPGKAALHRLWKAACYQHRRGHSGRSVGWLIVKAADDPAYAGSGLSGADSDAISPCQDPAFASQSHGAEIARRQVEADAARLARAEREALETSQGDARRAGIVGKIEVKLSHFVA